MANFPSPIPGCDSHSPALLGLFLSSNARICSAVTFSPLEKIDYATADLSMQTCRLGRSKLKGRYIVFCWSINYSSYSVMHCAPIQGKQFSLIPSLFHFWISNRWRTSPNHKMRVSYPDMVLDSRIEQFFVKCSSIWNIVFPQIFAVQYPAKKSCQPGKCFIHEPKEIKSFFPVKRENDGKTTFIWTFHM